MSWDPIPDDVRQALQALGLRPDNFEERVRQLRTFKDQIETDLRRAGIDFGMVEHTVNALRMSLAEKDRHIAELEDWLKRERESAA